MRYKLSPKDMNVRDNKIYLSRSGAANAAN